LMELTPAGEGQLNAMLRARLRFTGAFVRAFLWYMLFAVHPFREISATANQIL
jgi:hypothetical protein